MERPAANRPPPAPAGDRWRDPDHATTGKDVARARSRCFSPYASRPRPPPPWSKRAGAAGRARTPPPIRSPPRTPRTPTHRRLPRDDRRPRLPCRPDRSARRPARPARRPDRKLGRGGAAGGWPDLMERQPDLMERPAGRQPSAAGPGRRPLAQSGPRNDRYRRGAGAIPVHFPPMHRARAHHPHGPKRARAARRRPPLATPSALASPKRAPRQAGSNAPNPRRPEPRTRRRARRGGCRALRNPPGIGRGVPHPACLQCATPPSYRSSSLQR
jgi:hypothetical protein